LENEACLAYYGMTPTRLLNDHGVLGPDSTVVHATHVTAQDIAALGVTGTGVCACPSTEADLADGIGPFRRLRDAGAPLCLGSDQHPMTDLLGEARLLEADERLSTGERGRFRPAEMMAALTVDGHRALGWPDAGRIAPGQRADLVAVRLDSIRTAGCAPGQVGMAAAAADVHTVVVDGRVVVAEGRHVLGDVGRLLAEAIEPLWDGR
jgi:cytosine/adenosine deaminase-related metal-dependent hydrolase